MPGRDRVERSGSRDFSAQIPHTEPSGSMVRVAARRRFPGSGAKHPVLAPSAGSTWSLDFSHGASLTLWPFCLCPQKSLFLGNKDPLTRDWFERDIRRPALELNSSHLVELRSTSPKDCSGYLNGPFEISEIPKTLVLHILAVDRRQVLWFVQKGRQLSGMRMRRPI